MKMKQITFRNRIPPIKNPIGNYWQQPPRLDIKIDDEFARMSQKTFDLLYEYNTTVPSGHYPGKMWKAYVGDKWWLRWFSESNPPGKCLNNQREIILT